MDMLSIPTEAHVSACECVGVGGSACEYVGVCGMRVSARVSLHFLKMYGELLHHSVFPCH